MNVCINRISMNNSLLKFKFVRCLDIIKDLFHFFCLIARILLLQLHNTEKQKYFKLQLRLSILFSWKLSSKGCTNIWQSGYLRKYRKPLYKHWRTMSKLWHRLCKPKNNKVTKVSFVLKVHMESLLCSKACEKAKRPKSELIILTYYSCLLPD